MTDDELIAALRLRCQTYAAKIYDVSGSWERLLTQWSKDAPFPEEMDVLWRDLVMLGAEDYCGAVDV